MEPKNTMVALPTPPQNQSNSDKPTTDKRKPVRRDPEKRRQQNIQAQKKYLPPSPRVIISDPQA
ncbi:MAG: hypothetical protein Q9212_006200 [Teloschistes hypoglaucus]